MRAWVWLLLVAGCGSNGLPAASDGGADFAEAADFSTAAAADLRPAGRAATDHPPLPVISNHGGKIIAHMQSWTIVWKGDEALGADVNRFHAWMLASDYWTGSLGEYGVGAGAALGVIVLPDAAPAKLPVDNLETILQKLAAQPQYAPTPDTIYAFVVPATTTLVEPDGSSFCDYGDGYHMSTAGGLHYEVNLQCGGGADELHIVLSHEAAEAATDPDPLTAATWQSSDPPGEVGDLCVGLNAAYDVSDADGGTSDHYVVTRLWSAQQAATELHDPCVPAPSSPYFGAAINPSSIQITTDANGLGSAPAIIEPFAYGPVGKISWKIYAITGVSFVPDHGSGAAGDSIPITVKVNGAFQPQPVPIFIFSQSATGGSNLWNFSITVQ
jgi:hypothetical protein